MDHLNAEIIAIGDELISGQRIDTNSAWLSQALAELGVEPRFHTTVGDDLESGKTAFSLALERADIIISTGGIGPTQDDLTRQVIASVSGQELEMRPEAEAHIRSIFRNHNRDMPPSNLLQAYFPRDSKIIPNAEGTAPGIEITVDGTRRSTIFALPGVPYEMKEMWETTVRPAIQLILGDPRVRINHVIHCFGAGESQVESMLEGLTDRDRQPRIGITASQATISLRIVAADEHEAGCHQQIAIAKSAIEERLGNLVFGENGVELQDVVVSELHKREQSLAAIDFGFGGLVGQALFQSDPSNTVVKGAIVLSPQEADRWLEETPSEKWLSLAAHQIRQEFQTDWGIAISEPVSPKEDSVAEFEIAIAEGESSTVYRLRLTGHSGLRQQKAIKQILNQIRLHFDT